MNSTEKEIKRIKGRIDKNIRCGRYEKSISYISVLSSIFYHYRQFFTDEYIESAIVTIAKKLDLNNSYIKNSGTILYYDGFGYDLRGLTVEYVLGLCKLGFKVVYITDSRSEKNQPILHSLVDNYNIDFVYINKKSQIGVINCLKRIFQDFKPSVAFLYSFPHDIAAAITFRIFMVSCTVFKINLTDDFFWAGTSCFHYLIEFRNWGAALSIKHRHVDKRKEVLLPFYPFCQKSVEFTGLPFDSSSKFLFSGGSLFKTIDREMNYYKMLDLVLEKNRELIFFYVGNGEKKDLQHLEKKYPGRVFYQDERKDFLEVMKRCFMYLDTYPESGGLMIQYAVALGKLPLILKKNRAQDGKILINQEKIGVEYETPYDIAEEIKKCIFSEDYLNEKIIKSRNSIISEEEFNCQLKKIININNTDYQIVDEEIDITNVQKIALDEFDYREVFSRYIATRQNMSLFWDFPIIYIKNAVKIMLCKMT